MDGDEMDAPSFNQPCIIYELPDQNSPPAYTRTIEIHCERCGRFKFAHEASHGLNDLSDDERPIISEWVYEQNELGIVPTIKSANISALLGRRRLTFRERARRLLIYLSKQNQLPGVDLEYYKKRIHAVLQTYDEKLIVTICSYLEEEKLIKTRIPTSVSLTARGLMQAEDWGQTYVASRQGFVAMWFDQSLQAAWSDGFSKAAGFSKAIEDAGYLPKRIDKQEHINKICDEIIAEIRRSKFVVADFTGQRGGVYFEAGYAQGRDIPVIWSCRKDDLSSLHFDIQQYNCIDWETPEDLASRLQTRIEAVIGEGLEKARN